MPARKPPANPNPTLRVCTRAPSSIPLHVQHALRSLEWIERRENLILCGPSGTGKSHFLEALWHAAIDQTHTLP